MWFKEIASLIAVGCLLSVLTFIDATVDRYKEYANG
jgi:hypothetical protein